MIKNKTSAIVIYSLLFLFLLARWISIKNM